MILISFSYLVSPESKQWLNGMTPGEYETQAKEFQKMKEQQEFSQLRVNINILTIYNTIIVHIFVLGSIWNG